MQLAAQQLVSPSAHPSIPAREGDAPPDGGGAGRTWAHHTKTKPRNTKQNYSVLQLQTPAPPSKWGPAAAHKADGDRNPTTGATQWVQQAAAAPHQYRVTHTPSALRSMTHATPTPLALHASTQVRLTGLPSCRPSSGSCSRTPATHTGTQGEGHAAGHFCVGNMSRAEWGCMCANTAGLRSKVDSCIVA